MKHAADDETLQTSIFDAFYKNKLMQGKLDEQQRLYYMEYVKNMKNNNLNVQINKALLYTWKKESYIRQLIKNLQEYERKRIGFRDIFYESQLNNLEHITTNQQSPIIPLTEEANRLNINIKLQQFFQDNPVRMKSSKSIVKTDSNDLAQESPIDLTKQQLKLAPLSRNGSSKSKSSIKPHEESTTDDTSNVFAIGMSEKKRQSILKLTQVVPIRSRLFGNMEPVVVVSETLERQTRPDLVTMRSVRRPQRDPADLNLIFEVRKRIYQTNKRSYEKQLYHRRCGL
ncbi:unnamed protein product [Adineta steineri]|uniref:Uncharacterized protein n=1 Tax=Adineta steineri TaxID=433720 RepID=A0A813NDQ9_9BILA|nr:unnamed protein product [Adineta steineri]CAF3734096.1 unnamed protein product [Adineta steineri]